MAVVTKVVKAVTKRGRKSKRGRGLGSNAEKAEAKKLGISVKKLREGKKSAKRIKKAKPTVSPGTIEMVDVGTKASKRPLPSPSTEARMQQAAANIPGRRGAAIRRLTKQQEGVAREGMGVPEQRRISRAYPPTDPRNVGEGVNTALASKLEVEPNLRKYSKAQLRRLIQNGTVKIVRRGSHPDGSPRYMVVSTGRYAPPRGMVAEEMGLGGPQRALPSEEELVQAGGFQIRKRGGIVRRRTGGAIGVGAALRGFGKGYKKRGGNAF